MRRLTLTTLAMVTTVQAFSGCQRAPDDAVQVAAPDNPAQAPRWEVTDAGPPAAGVAAQTLAGSDDVRTAALGRALMHRY